MNVSKDDPLCGRIIELCVDLFMKSHKISREETLALFDRSGLILFIEEYFVFLGRNMDYELIPKLHDFVSKRIPECPPLADCPKNPFEKSL